MSMEDDLSPPFFSLSFITGGRLMTRLIVTVVDMHARDF